MVGMFSDAMYNFLGSVGDVCAVMVHSCRLGRSVRKLVSVMQFSLFI